MKFPVFNSTFILFIRSKREGGNLLDLALKKVA